MRSELEVFWLSLQSTTTRFKQGVSTSLVQASIPFKVTHSVTFSALSHKGSVFDIDQQWLNALWTVLAVMAMRINNPLIY